MLRDLVATGVRERVHVVGQHRLAAERVVGLLERGVDDAALDVDVADVVESARLPLGGIAGGAASSGRNRHQ